MHRRRTDWQCRLDSFLRQNQHRQFAYGRWDGCLFVADAIFEMIGVDVAASFRGKYSSARGALQAIREGTGTSSVRSAAEQTASLHCMPEIPASHAQRGDMVLIERGRCHSLGLVALNGREIVLVSKRGIWRLPIAFAAKAWQV